MAKFRMIMSSIVDKLEMSIIDCSGNLGNFLSKHRWWDLLLVFLGNFIKSTSPHMLVWEFFKVFQSSYSEVTSTPALVWLPKLKGMHLNFEKNSILHSCKKCSVCDTLKIKNRYKSLRMRYSHFRSENQFSNACKVTVELLKESIFR